MEPKIAVIIPCLNEEKTIERVISGINNYLPGALIYVFDNNSSDNTAEVASKAGAIVVKVLQRGKGQVVKAMFKKVEADIYVMIDGDNTYPTSRIADMVSPIINDEADMVVGSRIRSENINAKNFNEKGFKPLNLLGNLVYRKLINWIFGANLYDILSGYRAFNNRIVKTTPLMLKGFEVETELTIKAIERGYRIKEIPVELSERPAGSHSKIKILKDGLKIFRTILSLFRDYKPLTFFGFSGLLLFIVGLIPGLVVISEYISTGLVMRFPLAILSVGIILSSIIWIIAGIILHTIDRRFQEIEHFLYSLWDSSK